MLASRALETHPRGADDKSLARSVLVAVYELLVRNGQDGVLAAHGCDLDDRAALADHEVIGPAFATAIGALDLDGGGPRNARPLRLADAVVSTLGLELVDDVPATLLADGVRNGVVAAVAGAVDGSFALPQLRDSIVARGRELCELRFHGAYDKVAAQLDERGQRVMKVPKVPIDALQAAQQALADARRALMQQVGRAAIDGAVAVIARGDAAAAEAAGRVGKPVTHRLTPRDVAILRASDAAVPKTPAGVARALLDGLCDTARLAWAAAEVVARPYAASGVFVVGEVIEHPKFGRGTVTATEVKRIDVEFADGMHTLVHAGTVVTKVP